MLNFNITSSSDHLLALRNYVRCNGCTDQAVLAVLFDELEIPLEDYMKNIIGLAIQSWERYAFRDYIKFGTFHSAPDFESLTAELLDSISRVAVSAHIQDCFPTIIRTACDFEKKIVTIHYECNDHSYVQGSLYGNFTQKDFQVTVQDNLSRNFNPRSSTNVLELAVAELAEQCRPVAKFGDLNCYSVSSEEITEAIAKHTKVSGLSSDYVLLRDILQRLYPTYEAFLAERSFIVNAGKINNELAAMYPEHAWKEAVTLERIIYHIGFLRDRLGAAIELGTSLITFQSLSEQDRNKFLAYVYRDASTKEELDNAELEVVLNGTLDRLGYDDDQKFFTIVVQDQPSTNE
jgi:hypothetical protein